MNLKNIRKTLSALLLGVVALTAAAQEVPEVTIIPAYGDGGLWAISPNGQWAVGDAQSEAGAWRAYPRVVNTSTGKDTPLWNAYEQQVGMPIAANSVSNDGKTVGGSYQQYPAVWKDGKWNLLEVPQGDYNEGLLRSITPDGKYGVGNVSKGGYCEYPCMWDLETLKLIELPGIVDENPLFRREEFPDEEFRGPQWAVNVRPTAISPDGKKILGVVDFIFTDDVWEFLYDRDTKSWKPLGFNYDGRNLTPADPDIANVQETHFSSDGKYICGYAYTRGDSQIAFSCLTDSPENFTLVKDDGDTQVTAIGTDGIIYAADPVLTPLRNWKARVGNYWYDWKIVLKQIYGLDWMEDVIHDEDGYSGQVCGLSDDNLTLLVTNFAKKESYIIRLPKPMAEICADVDLLANYSVFPPAGSEFSKLVTLTMTFDRKIAVKGEQDAVMLVDENDDVVRRSSNFTVQQENPYRIDIIFRPTPLDPGKNYTVVIPAGAVSVGDDENITNKEIRIVYGGRAEGAVKPVRIAPEDGSVLSSLSLSVNPIVIDFDAIIETTGEGKITISQLNGDKKEHLFDMNAMINNRQLIVYPYKELRLANGNDYVVEFDAGIVADLSGAGGNEAFSLTYHGDYKPEIDPTSNIIYNNEFVGGLGDMLLYEGDHNEPTAEMKSYSFDADNTPWARAADDEVEMEGDDIVLTIDMFAAMSHSQYEPAGKSDDWMVTPMLYIPDDKATLTFSSQGFLQGKQDRLKVFVWESDDILTYLTKNIVDDIRYNGDCVYDEVQDPGASAGKLAGEWNYTSVDLAKYAGKNVYIAFLNDNQNQSIVFVGSVKVSRDVLALLALDNETTLINADKTVVSGRAQIEKQEGLQNFTVSIADAEGNVLETIVENELWEKGEEYNFEFENPVSLEKGKENFFTVTLADDDTEVAYNLVIKNLAFETTKKVVVEDFTGTNCGFCPLGILAFENMHKVLGDIVIPLGIHSYTGGSVFQTAELSAYGAFINTSAAAPMGTVNRGPLSGPMYNDGQYQFTSPYLDTWLDLAGIELNSYADADVEIAGWELGKEKIQVDMNVNYALDLENANVRVFGLVVEDQVEGPQSSNVSGNIDPNLGEWAKGGLYGKPSVIITHDHVVRGTSATATVNGYTGFNGNAGYIPTTIKAGENMNVKFEFNRPKNIEEENNCRAVVMLIDGKTNRVINAAQTDRLNSVDGVFAETVVDGIVYDLTGRIVMRDANAADLNTLDSGIYILNGRKYIVK